ncbi:OsmC-like protein [compost metagenome]
MSIMVTTQSSDSYRHTLMVDEQHELATDMPKAMGGEGSAPEPHDYFDAALGACKALTVTHYARQHNLPLTGVSVEVSHDSSREKEGFYSMTVDLTLKGGLTDEQRAELKRVADRCPLHKLMTQAEVSIETRLSQGPFSQ